MGVFFKRSLKTGEACFCQVLQIFFQDKQKEKHEALPGELNYEKCQGWRLTQKELMKVFHLKRAAFKHLSAGKGLTLLEFERLCRSVFATASSQEDSLVGWINIAELLFYHGHDAEVEVPSPFDRKPLDIFEEMIEKRVKEEVERRLRLEHLKQKTDAIKD